MTAAVIVGAITVELFCITVIITVIISVLLDTIYVRMFDKEMPKIETIIMVLIVFAGVVWWMSDNINLFIDNLSILLGK